MLLRSSDCRVGLVRLSAVWAIVSLAPLAAFAQTSVAPIDFGRDIQPILARRCFACHGPDQAEGGLRLDRQDNAFGKADSGEAAIVPGHADDSELLHRVRSTDDADRMPAEGKPLTAEQIDLLERWIASGAEWERHWAFRPVDDVSIPEIKQTDQARNPIDHFVLYRIEQAGLTPAPPAPKAALLRRLHFDLTGLPPTPADVESFLNDDSPDAYERVVDRLLASPQFGETWARHWLDVVRFAETNSFERDGPKPNAWRYRDYVIRSFNDNKPYDQFIREQLAGDELGNVTPETIIATGFYRLGVWDDEPADPELALYDGFDDIVTTVGQGFLGLTFNCARCHDHKIDPIKQTDYYSLVAFFRDLRPYGTRGDQLSWNQTDISPPEVARLHQQKDADVRRLRAAMHEIEQQGIVKMSAEDQRRSEGRDRQKLLDEKLESFLNNDQWANYSRLKEEFQAVERRPLPPREAALSVRESYVHPPETFLLQRGTPGAHGERVDPAYPVILDDRPAEIPPPGEQAKSSGRRRAFADWVASPDNLLTSRVIVNRLWQHHFGRGIVRSANNFGQLGDPPTHPQLLDWLAGELIRHDWNLKPIHRLIVLSGTYRQSSQASDRELAADPRNDLFWRYDMRRLSAEAIRDATHAVTGAFNPAMYGPSIYPALSQEVLQSQSQPGLGWGKSSPAEQARRSIYIHVKRSLITPMLAAFDFPETDTTCEARFTTIQPAQSLELMNGNFAHERAAAWADSLRQEFGDNDEALIRAALERALSRSVTADDIAPATQLLHTLRTTHALPNDQATALTCLYVLNLNEFLFLD